MGMHCSGRPPRSPRGGRPETGARCGRPAASGSLHASKTADRRSAHAIADHASRIASRASRMLHASKTADRRSAHRNGVGRDGRGSRVSPMRNSSTAAAQERPSAMAQTIRLWPRPMSPHTNTFGEVRPEARRRGSTLPRSLISTPSCSSRPASLRTDEAHREQHELASAARSRCRRPARRSCGRRRSSARPRAPAARARCRRRHRGSTRCSPRSTRSPPSSCADDTR